MDFQADVLGSDIPVLVDFWATWCGPCRMLSPTIDALEKEYDGRIKVVKIDTDANSELAVEYGIMSVPTIMIFKNGEVVDQVSGLKTKADLEEMINKQL